MASHLSTEEPVIDAAALAAKVSGLIVSLGAILTIVGFTGPETDWNIMAQAVGAAILAIGGVVGTILPIINAFKARAKVTPLANPVDSAGIRLTPAGS